MDVDTQIEGPPKAPKPHDFLWFPDGNVVLATDVYLFKVHKSLLAVHSSVFRDMFELPNVGHADPTPGQGGAGLALETYEGVPTVAMVGDKGEDVAHLLRAVFEPNYYRRDNDNTSLEVIVALLLLSTKYDFNTVRKDVILQVSRQYPMTLQEFESLYYDESPLFGRKRRDCHFPLLAAAVTAEADVLLPSLYFACSDYSIGTIFQENQGLPREALHVLIQGRDAVDNGINRFIASLPQYIRQSNVGDECQNGGRCLADAFLYDVEEYIQPQFRTLIGNGVARDCLSSVCDGCRSFVVRAVDKQRQDTWDSIPEYYEFPEWASLKAKPKAYVET